MLLEYLKLCVNGAILDHIRTLERKKIAETDVDIIADSLGNSGENVEAEEIWESLLSSLKDEREVIVFECAYVFDMTAKQILTQNPQHFSEVKEVYRVKENMLRRLKRNSPLHSE
jgi:DNA-directed RNA polymerase specialized sigma subunit